MKKRPIIGLTMGDPAGIGPEICLRALSEPAVLEKCVPVLFGDIGILQRLAGKTARRSQVKRSAASKRSSVAPLSSRICTVSLNEFNGRTAVSEPLVVDCNAIEASAIRPGEVAASCGKAAYSYIEHAIQAALAGQIAGVATAPIHKEALRMSGVPYPGHTEIFAALTRARRSCMMLYSEALTVSMVTTHIGFAEVPRRLSIKRVLDVIELTSEAMQRLLGRPARLGVCGLNPHAGEHGLFGNEEEERHVLPAIKRAKKRGISVEGPLPPDAAFTAGQRKRFDAIVTLYHDQGHIPFKMLAFETGVNLTLGLPIVRASVDHGTAFDIAWKGLADPRSMYEAIYVAARLASGRGKPDQSHRGNDE